MSQPLNPIPRVAPPLKFVMHRAYVQRKPKGTARIMMLGAQRMTELGCRSIDDFDTTNTTDKAVSRPQEK